MKDDFSFGVVEGFYGVPWTADQRKLLFNWMQKMGLNTYMYAPKDDCKHRAYWRELYSVEEADDLTSLIENAHEKGVTFVYAISPGLDISFSNSKDVQALKRKLEQVAAFGCEAFAILFDDIDPELSEADQNAFSSSACAQVSVTNEVYEHLGQPKFYFCPTEYCAARSLPNVLSSEYLITVGAKLLPGIHVMWTGCKVISKKITIQTLEDISTVLKRAPVIWDNIHANDYDPRRIFLGPYEGRSPEIIPYIRGVMTNPNCEFEANYIACHTLGQWSKANPDGVKKDVITNERLSPVLSDIKLETESDLGSEDDLPSHCWLYKPRQALQVAMQEWLQELASNRDPPKRTLSPSALISLPPNVPSSPILAPVVVSACSSPVDSGQEKCSISNPSFLQPVSQPQAITSLISPTLSPQCITASDSVSDAVSDALSDTLSDAVSDYCCEVEPMECSVSTSSSVVSNLNQINTNVQTSLSVTSSLVGNKGVEALSDTTEINQNVVDSCNNESVMQMEDSLCEKLQGSNQVAMITPSVLTEDDVSLLVDLFYLPFEHGSRSVQYLQSLNWLLTNAHCLQGDQEKEKVAVWREQLAQFEAMVQAVDVLMMRLFVGPNKSVLCDLYAYLWDIKGVLGVCLAYVKWLGFSKGYREAFASGDQEPWIFRGGLQAELQRLLPICNAHDLFLIKTPEWLVQKLYSFRPYSAQDETAVYELCLRTCDEGVEGSLTLTQYPNLLGDRLIGNFVTLSPEFCFVTEDGESVCGYVMAAPDAKQLAIKSNESWVPRMQSKYPKPAVSDPDPAEELLLSFYTQQLGVKEEVCQSYPSVLRLDIMVSRMHDAAVPRRLLACALCALKAAGSKGVHTKLNTADKFMVDFYAKLGFFPITTAQDSSDVVYMGRLL